MQPQGQGDLVPGVLDRMERHARGVRLAILGAAIVEGLLMVVALFILDWSDRSQVLVLTLSVLGYTLIVLGLIALGSHVSRVGARVVAALDSRGAG